MKFWRGRLRGAGPTLFFRERDGELEGLARPPWEGLEVTHLRGKLEELEVEVPATPSKIVCIGRNYREHAKELGHDVPEIPTLFLKPVSALLAPGRAIERPRHLSALVHHEGELAVVVGRRLKNATREEAEQAVFAYTAANDVTARDLQREDKHFSRAKGFDTFCPLGPKLVTPDELPDPVAGLDLEVTVSGETRQRGSTREMVFPVGHLLAYVSRIMRFEPGDVLLTGTPAGVGPLVAGDVVRVTIGGIGTLENPVVDGPELPPLPST